MSMLFYRQKKKPSPIKRFSFLPRIGIYLDIAGYEFVFKQASILEALLNLQGKNLSLPQFLKISKDQLSEIKFPKYRENQVLNTTAKTISAKQL